MLIYVFINSVRTMNSIDFFVTFLFYVAMLYMVVRMLSNWVHQYLDKSIEQLDVELQQLKDMIKYVKVEQHGDIIYVFDNETDAFLVQGRTAEDFQHNISHDMVLKIAGGDDQVKKKFKEMFPAGNTP